MSIDLDNVSQCPSGNTCAGCGNDVELNIVTIGASLGVFCLTLCVFCVQFKELPRFPPTRVVDAVLRHCGHLGITADEMDRAMKEMEGL